MSYADQFSRYPTMKGIAVDLPFLKFRYVKVDKGETEQPKYAKTIDLTIPSENVQPQITTSKIIIPKEADFSTLGLDPMISYASVIHELTYGRIDKPKSYNLAQSYPSAKFDQTSSYSLDIIV